MNWIKGQILRQNVPEYTSKENKLKLKTKQRYINFEMEEHQREYAKLVAEVFEMSQMKKYKFLRRKGKQNQIESDDEDNYLSARIQEEIKENTKKFGNKPEIEDHWRPILFADVDNFECEAVNSPSMTIQDHGSPEISSLIFPRKIKKIDTNQYQPIEDLQTDKIQELCQYLGINSIEDEKQLILNFIENQYENIQGERIKLIQIQKLYIDIKQDLKRKMKEKMNIYDGLRRKSKLVEIKPPTSQFTVRAFPKKKDMTDICTNPQSGEELQKGINEKIKQKLQKIDLLKNFDQVDNLDEEINDLCKQKIKSHNLIQQQKQQIFQREMSINLYDKNISRQLEIIQKEYDDLNRLRIIFGKAKSIKSKNNQILLVQNKINRIQVDVAKLQTMVNKIDFNDPKLTDLILNRSRSARHARTAPLDLKVIKSESIKKYQQRKIQTKGQTCEFENQKYHHLGDLKRKISQYNQQCKSLLIGLKKIKINLEMQKLESM